MARADRVRIAAAKLSGIAAAVAHVRRVGEDEALGEVAAVLDTLPRSQRQAALDRAIVAYVTPSSGLADPWYPAAAAFLRRAGAQDRGT